MPYHYFTTGHILTWLHALEGEGVPVNTLATRDGIERWVLRQLKAAFRRVVRILRLPGRAEALDPPEFIRSLARKTGQAVAGLFRGWKETEPKHSVVGIYPR